MDKVITFSELVQLDKNIVWNSTLDLVAFDIGERELRYATLFVKEFIGEAIGGRKHPKEMEIVSLKLYTNEGYTYIVTSTTPKHPCGCTICSLESLCVFLYTLIDNRDEEVPNNQKAEETDVVPENNEDSTKMHLEFIKILVRNRLREQIKKNGIKSVLRMFSISPETLDKILYNKYSFTHGDLEALCKGLGIDINGGIEQCISSPEDKKLVFNFV